MGRRAPRAIVVGGSVGGLFAASLLRAAGWEATVFERSGGDLASRGAGIGLSQELLEVMARIGTPLDPSIGVPLDSYLWLDRDGSARHEHPRPMVASAWARVYRPVRAAFPDAHYRSGAALERVEQDDAGVTAIFADGSRVTGDLLVAADGSLSTVRGQFHPGLAPRYAGYVAWRGIVEEADLPQETRDAVQGHIVFSFPERELMLNMLVPGAGDDIRPGRRRIYFIWYRPTDGAAGMRDLFTDATGRDHGVAIPPPLIRPELVAAMKDRAEELFAPAAAAIVRTVGQPLLQAISDLETPRMVHGRVALIGDAAFVARPHVASGVTKAALDAACLADSLQAAGDDIDAGLAAFESDRLAFGRELVAHARLLGARIETGQGDGAADPKLFDPLWIMREYGAPRLLRDAVVPTGVPASASAGAAKGAAPAT